MKITLGELRKLLHEALRMYHGSPYGGIKRFTDYRGRIPFKCKVAALVTTTTPGDLAQVRSEGEKERAGFV